MMPKISNFFKKEKYDDLTNKYIIKVNTNNIVDASINVDNYNGVLQFICGDIKRSLKLTTYLKVQLTKIFGKHNTVRNTNEYFYYVWIVEFDGEIFQIFTAKCKGTQFSIIGRYENDKSKVCINFLRKIEELLDNVENY